MKFARAHKMSKEMAKDHIESRLPKWQEEFKDAILTPYILGKVISCTSLFEHAALTSRAGSMLMRLT